MSNKETTTLSLGIDIGSTTAKLALLDGDVILYRVYERHFSQVREKLSEMLEKIRPLIGDRPFKVSISGSAGLGLAQSTGTPFVQEVFVVGELVKALEPDTSAVIELGGEDAKIIFLDGGLDERMNGTCAGGTGAFIDQMATLLNMSVEEMDKLSLQYNKLYPIASRCGVFAKTDIQPLLNQGAQKADVAASIYQAVVNQTIAGLARGKTITGKVLFLGGPLHFCKGLQQRFKETLKLSDENAIFPEYGRFAVAQGAALKAAREEYSTTLDALQEAIKKSMAEKTVMNQMPVLFETDRDFQEFKARHEKADVALRSPKDYNGKAYLGIDCGSTTTKLVLLSENKEILYSFYSSNKGNPVEVVEEQLINVYRICGDHIKIAGSAVTGYGEELIKNAFDVDTGVVETIAHYTAAAYFCPDVDFILDIGGQDIKCFRIRNHAIDSIMLNEACSSGCGSFLETFARSMGYSIADFAQRGIFGKNPVNLGSRCTVFMNSSVKQAQKDGAGVEDISAGLSMSVVKNALYKVIRVGSADELGQNIVVQGGTFYNDAVLRAFEMELGHNVIRPAIAGLMGAYGAALIAMDHQESTLIGPEGLQNFVHKATSTVCKGCTNQCRLTINQFNDGKRFVSGNRCERMTGRIADYDQIPNLHAYKRKALLAMQGGENRRGRIGLPLALGMYELLPLWNGIFRSLGFEVVLPEMSTRQTYERGQFSIPSDTVCYPAKLMHGHIEELIEKKTDVIFYPCLSYNVDEKKGDNHYNCPVVAYYSELLQGNMDSLKSVNFLYPYLNINDPKELSKELYKYLSPYYPDLTKKECKLAVKQGFADYEAYMADLRKQGEAAIKYAREHGKRIMVLAGRPYHVDAEVGHGIDDLAVSLGFVVVSEDSIWHLAKDMPRVHVLNQWTYHARLYRAACFAAENPDVELVQLVSFGCGVDAITTDEVRSILEERGKFYTQIKIDEITNLGAVKIRLRSLIGALERRKA